MHLSKRQFMSYSAASAVALAFGIPVTDVLALADQTNKQIAAFAGGKAPVTGKVTLTTPEIAENGNTVPVAFDVESPMTAADHVTEVMLLADGNPNPGVATFKFTPMSGRATATTRIRLAKTQNVIAVAKTSSGAIFMANKLVKVTIGGCGG